jgi:glycosyltransferase involved in cell wall biosynthesis
MKVALVVPGGVDVSGEHRVIPALLWLIERLAARHEVHVFALAQEPLPGKWNLLGARVHNIGRGLAIPRAIQTIAGEHRNSGFGVVHGFWAGAPGLVAVITARLLRIPSLVHVAGGEFSRLPDIGYGGRLNLRGRACVWACMRGADISTGASTQMVALAEKLGYRLRRLPLGVDTGTWPPRPPRPRGAGRMARLVHVASLNPVKDQSTLLHALAMLASDHVGFHLDLIGEDTVSGKIHLLAKQLGIERQITIHGFLTQDRVRPLVENADVMVMSSRQEAGPIAMLEAAMVGVPTVGTAVGHIAEWAPDAAVACAVADPTALAGALGELLGNEARRMQIANAARARALCENADVTAARINALYEEVTARRQTSM